MWGMCSGRVLATPQHVIHAAVKLYTRQRCEWRWWNASEHPPVLNRAPNQMKCDAVIGNDPLMLRHIPYFYFDNLLPRQPFSAAVTSVEANLMWLHVDDLSEKDPILDGFSDVLFFPAFSTLFPPPTPQLSIYNAPVAALPLILASCAICVNRCTEKERKINPSTWTCDSKATRGDVRRGNHIRLFLLTQAGRSVCDIAVAP